MALFLMSIYTTIIGTKDYFVYIKIGFSCKFFVYLGSVLITEVIICLSSI
ncbi:unknown [Bacteroides sp. CAG:1076]|jgi:hypothetical protein|nr:unknown [Bacteroides sp. CAG:1076]